VVAPLLVAGCGSPAIESADGSGAIARLAALAAEPSRGAGSTELIEPPDSSIRELEGSDPLRELADASLAEVVRGWPGSVVASADDGAGGGGGASISSEALGLYAEARQLQADSEATRAIVLLERAAELDPQEPAVWRALGMSRRQAGYEATAGAALVRAAELGLDEPEALTLAGLHLLRRGEAERAAGVLIRAVNADPPHADPLVGLVAMAHLGESLLELGRVRAGNEALEVGLRLPAAARVPTNVGAEAGAVQRRQGELLRRVGDGWCRLGEFDRAASAYEESARTPTGDTPETTARWLYALRRAGRHAAAAALIVEELRAGAPLDARTLSAMRSLAERLNPRSLLADAVGEIEDGGSATRRVDLVLARAAALPRRRALALIDDAIAVGAGSLGPAPWGRLLEARFASGDRDPVAMVALAEGLVERFPSMSGAVVAALHAGLDRPAEAWGLIEGREMSPGVRFLMLGELALRLEDADRVAEALRGLPPGETGAEVLALSAALGAAAGDWARVDASVALLRATGSERSLLRALESAQRFEAARPLARGLVEVPGASVDDLMHGSAILHLLGETDGARAALERAIEADPFDERAYRALLTFHGPNGPRPDGERSAEIGRLLRERVSGGRLLRQVVIGEMLRRGLVDEAGERLATLFEEDPADEQTLDAVLTRWRSLAAADRRDEIDLDPVKRAVGDHPASDAVVRLLAAGLILRAMPAEALAEVEAYEARTGSRSLERLREQVIREGLGDTARADALTAERLARSPRSIDRSLELAEFSTRAFDGAAGPEGGIEAVAAALRGVPDDARLTDAQRAVAAGVVARVAGHLAARRERVDPTARQFGPVSESGLACLGWASSRGVPMAPAVHDLGLTLLAESRADLGRMGEAARRAMEAYPASSRAFARRLTDLLLGASRADDAFAWASGASFDADGALQPEMFAEWFRLVVLSAEPARGRAMLDALVARGGLTPAWEAVRPDSGDWAEREPSAAEMAYLLAQYAGGASNREATSGFLRLALEYDARHPWACNDLGYTLLEEGGSLEEAERLVEIAFEAMPDRANIVDSLGWVRYHRGELEDETNPETGLVKPGAVTLLSRAASLEGTADDGVVHDHLGDALHRSGRREEAVEAWRRAAQMANAALSRMRASGNAGGVRFREVQRLAVDAAMKINALELGQEPAVSPQRGVAP